MYTNIHWLNAEHTQIGATHESGVYRSTHEGGAWWDGIMAAIENGEPVAEYEDDDTVE